MKGTIIILLFALAACDDCQCDCQDDIDASSEVVEDVLADEIDEDVAEVEEDADVAETTDAPEEADADVLVDAVEDLTEASCRNAAECNTWCIEHEGFLSGGCFILLDPETGRCQCLTSRSECECSDD